MGKGIEALEKISSNKDSLMTVSVIVLKDSIIQKASDISGRSLASVGALDDKFINKIVKNLAASKVTNAESYPVLVAGLYDKTNEIIIFNEAYRGLIETTITNFKNDTRIIKQYTFKNPNSKSKVNLVNDSSPFNIYISGIDTHDPIGTEGLSDVNIVATVDPIEKKLLLLTIPRDSYVPIALGGNNQKDKLTHAGIYGVDSSMQTIENLLDIQIDAYVRVNFTALIDMVDVLGGVDVDSPIGFRSSGGDWFSAGTNHINGKQALTFSRERQQLEGGDNDRGKNQERVIVAILNKLSKPENLRNYQSILSVLGSSLQTNLSIDSITKLVNMQLGHSGSWDIEMDSISGTPAPLGLPSYAMPGSNLYFTKLSADSIKSAKQKINAITKVD